MTRSGTSCTRSRSGTEARAALRFGFREIALDEIVSFTVPANGNSRRMMEKVGMRRDLAADFDHPSLPAGHLFRRHVLYRAQRTTWLLAT